MKKLRWALPVGVASVLLAAGCAGTAEPVEITTAPPVPSQGSGDEWIVGLGDSFMSGEGGRWASNGAGSGSGWEVGSVDEVYGDADGQEAIRYCHRSNTALMHLGGPWNSINLACSGAQTNSFFSESIGAPKPGLDNVTVNGVPAQTEMLQEFATDHDVKVVVLSIGGNDLGFGDILAECVQRFLADQDACADDEPESIKQLGKLGGKADFTDAVSNDITSALNNIAQAMANAGEKNGSWRLIYQLPPVPVADADTVAFPETYARQTVGGCGLYDADLKLSNDFLLPRFHEVMITGAEQFEKSHPDIPVTILNDGQALAGHTLCEENTERVNGEGSPDWETTGKNGEWVRWVSIIEQKAPTSDWDTADENLHPNYWGQLALRSCLRETLELVGTGDKSVPSVSCRPAAAKLNKQGEPQMVVTEGSA